LNKDKGKVKSPFYLFYSILIGAVEFEEKERRRTKHMDNEHN